jgi:hypothetical protein
VREKRGEQNVSPDVWFARATLHKNDNGTMIMMQIEGGSKQDRGRER